MLKEERACLAAYRGATFARIDTTSPSSSFTGDIFNTMVDSKASNLEFVGAFYSMLSFTLNPTASCLVNGAQSIPDASINIYKFNNVVIAQGAGGTCTMVSPTNYSGLAAVIDGSSMDNTLIYAISNGTKAEFAVLKH